MTDRGALLAAVLDHARRGDTDAIRATLARLSAGQLRALCVDLAAAVVAAEARRPPRSKIW